VLKLNKALYDLKQSAQIWYLTLREVLLNKLHFKILETESCIFINHTTNIILSIFINNIPVISASTSAILDFIQEVEKYFKIKNLGPIQDYLGIDILKLGPKSANSANSAILSLSQANYIQKVLEQFGLQDYNPAYTFIDSKIKLVPNRLATSKASIKLFQCIIGCLLYIMLSIRPDITYLVIKLARFASNPASEYIIAAKRILRYLKATINYKINYSAGTNTSSVDPGYISGYCNANYASDLIKAKSTTRFIFFLAGGPIS